MTIAGLDIGSTKVCAIVAQVTSNNKANVIGVGTAPCKGLKRGVVVNMDETVRAIEEAVKKAEQMSGVLISSVFVGVTGEHITSLNSKGVIAIIPSKNREITQEDVNRVVENSRSIVIPPDREIIHAIPRGFSIDGHDGIKQPVGMCGERLEVETHIVTGANTFLQNIERCVIRAGMEVDEIVLETIASSSSVLTNEEKESGVVLVDIGGGTTDVAIFKDGFICYSGVVPIGGQYVTLDINKLLRTSPEEAERLKIEHGSALSKKLSEDEVFSLTQLGTTEQRLLPKRVLAEIIEPRMEELFTMVRQLMQKSGFYGLLPGGLVLTGGGSKLRGVKELAQELLGHIPARVGGPVDVGGLTDTVSNPIYATAVGLACYGASTQHQEEEVQTQTFFEKIIEFLNFFKRKVLRLDRR